MGMQHTLRQIQVNPQADGPWTALFSLLAEADAAQAIALATLRHQIRQDAAGFTYARTIELAKAGKLEVLRRLYDADGPQGAFRGIFAFGLGLCASRAFDLGATVALLREAAFLNTHCCQKLFAHEQEFCVQTLGQMLQQAALLEPESYAAAPAGTDIELPELPQGGPVVFASCCDTYFAAYAERFVRQLADAWPEARVLIHVLNPTGNGDEARRRLAAEFPGLGFSGEACREDGALYASRRFMVAPAVRTRYGADLIIMDIDSVFRPDFHAIVEASTSSRLSYFGNAGEMVPSLLISAAYIHLPYANPVADRFLAHCAAYLERKFDEAVVPWTVDQAALFRALCMMGDDRALTMDLSARIMGGVKAIVAEAGHDVPEAVRRSRRQGGDLAHVEFDADRRPTLFTR